MGALVNLRGIKAGDLVRLKADGSLYEVVNRSGRRLRVRLLRGARGTHHATSYEVVEAWRKVQR
jgi:hypothetical protein